MRSRYQEYHTLIFLGWFAIDTVTTTSLYQKNNSYNHLRHITTAYHTTPSGISVPLLLDLRLGLVTTSPQHWSPSTDGFTSDFWTTFRSILILLTTHFTLPARGVDLSIYHLHLLPLLCMYPSLSFCIYRGEVGHVGYVSMQRYPITDIMYYVHHRRFLRALHIIAP